MKTGLESLDVGASDITYSGNEGPKSPQEDQRMMQEFQMQQMAGGENDRVRELLLLEETQGLTEEEKEELRQLIKTISAGMEGGIGDMAMKSGLIDEYRNYKMNQEDAGEPFMSPRDYYRSQEQDRMGVKEGGIMRTAFQGGGRDAGKGSNFGNENFGGGQGKNDNQPTYSPPPRGPAELGISSKSPDAPPEPDDKGTFEQNLNQAKAIINAQLTPTTFNKIKNYIPYVGTLSKLGIIPTAKRKMEIARKNDLLREIQRIRAMDPNYTGDMITEEFFDTEEGEKYLRDAGVFDGPDLGDNKDGPPIILPTILPMGGGADLDPEDLGTEFISQFTSNPLTEADQARISNIGGKSIFLADGGRASYADGGITDLRQGYFLGKLVKKATRGLKKFFKSPIAQAALLAGGGYFLRNKIPTGNAFGGKLFDKLLRMKDPTKGFDPFKVGILGASALTGLYAKQDQDDEPTLDEYMSSANRGPGIDPRGIREYIAMNKGNINPMDYSFLNPAYYQNAADGGRIGLAAGGIGDLRGALSKEMFGYDDDEDEIKKLAMGGSAGMPPVTMQPGGQDAQSFGDDESTGIPQATPTTTLPNQMPIPRPMMDPRMMQQMMMAQRGNSMMNRGMPMMGGRMMAQEGGMMDMGGMEKDYRNEGGFVPIGEYERKDDVPARLSKNEFVFTADAVRNAGGGDIDKGAEIMENMMENLEAGGKVSKGSQGLSGAREMFATQQRLGEVL